MKFDGFMKEFSENPNETETIRQIAFMVSDIIKRRKMLGLTQAQVASKAGLSQAQVVRLENSLHIPKADTLIKVASAPGMNIFEAHEDDYAIDDLLEAAGALSPQRGKELSDEVKRSGEEWDS